MTANKTTMTREQLLAAEIFGYSYATYQDHIDIENVRYEELMPVTVAILERASREAWPMASVATELDTDEQNASELMEGYQRATLVVDAENPAEAFRKAVRFCVLDAVENGLSTEEAIDSLVTQICFRTADLAYLLDREARPLSGYSRHLRREPHVDYHEGYFDEDDRA